jgi:hypothetical protein
VRRTAGPNLASTWLKERPYKLGIRLLWASLASKWPRIEYRLKVPFDANQFDEVGSEFLGEELFHLPADGYNAAVAPFQHARADVRSKHCRRIKNWQYCK